MTSYTFTLGKLECVLLLDAATTLDNDRFLRRFPDATEADYRQAFAGMGLSFDEADSSMNILVIKMENEIVMIDAGEGGRPTGGEVVSALREVNLTPEEITQVIITHSHGDHVHGLLDFAGAPVFPNASYVISDVEMDFWQTRNNAEHQPIIAMIREKGLRQIAMDEQILPGLTAIPLPGHTPGQIGLLLDSGGERLLHLADLLHSPMQFSHPEWSARFDHDTAQSVPTRYDALQRAADERLLTLFYHLTFPGMGYVERGEHGFIWRETRS